MKAVIDDSAAVLRLIKSIERPDARIIIAIAGPPGSGKSTLADVVVKKLNEEMGADTAALLPMDGFHLDNEILIERGLLERKGAPQTFDAEGLLALINEVRNSDRDIRYPVFDRVQDRSISDLGLLTKDTPIVVVEGNYLLMDTPVWNRLLPLFDASVFLSPSLEKLEKRLISRWLDHGFSEQAAKDRARGNDLKNARVVLEHSQQADLVLGQSGT